MKRLSPLFLAALLTATACRPGPAPTAEPPGGEPTGGSPLPTESPLLPPESPLPRPGVPVGGGERTGAVLLFIAPSGFSDDEYVESRAVLESASYTVLVASVSLDTATGMFGTEVQPDLALAGVDVRDYDAVIFVGGSGAQAYWDDEEAHRVAQDALAQERVLGAICVAPVILARAGVLEGKRATVYDAENLRPELEAGGAICTGAPVQRDGLIVTAFGPQVSEQFAEEIVRVLQEQ